jgi:hypothetical protein
LPAAFNVNVPNRPLSSVSGVRPARLAGAGAAYRRIDGCADDTDVALLVAGHVTVSAIVALDGVPGDAAAAADWLGRHLSSSRVPGSDMIAS